MSAGSLEQWRAEVLQRQDTPESKFARMVERIDELHAAAGLKAVHVEPAVPGSRHLNLVSEEGTVALPFRRGAQPRAQYVATAELIAELLNGWPDLRAALRERAS